MDDISAILEPVYTVRQLAEWSGHSMNFWRQQINRRKLRALAFGASIRILRSVLGNYLAAAQKNGPIAISDPRQNGKRPTSRPRIANGPSENKQKKPA
jgi:hypothetical protein